LSDWQVQTKVGETVEVVTARDAVVQAALTDVGLRRANNQDTVTVALAGDDVEWRRHGHLFMVADGMGAHQAGELASQIPGESVPHAYRKFLDRSPPEALRQAVHAANANIHERGQANAEFQGMGTTCSVLVLLPTMAIVAHVGDSRVYRLRRGKLEQLTFDHSLVWEMQATGQMPRGEVAGYIPKNIITRSLGPHADVQIDLEGPFPLETGDAFLVCSDGLSGQVKDEEIGAILGSLDPPDAVRILIDMANLRGGPDNITAIAVRVNGVPPAEAAEPQAAPTVQATPAVHPALWSVMALCVLGSLALAAVQYYMVALASWLVAAATAVLALVQNTSHGSPQHTFDVGKPLGKGPHLAWDCQPGAESAAVLGQMAQQLRDAAKEEHWTLDWPRFNSFGEQARAALTAGDFQAAVRQYALAISFMMSEIRHQPSHKVHRDRSVLDL
jgi:PPM family protein phosphatase